MVGVWYPNNYYVPFTLPGDPKASTAKMYITLNPRAQIGTFGRGGYGNNTHAGTIGTDGSTVWCGPPYTTDYCYEYSGGSSFTVTPLASSLHVELDSSIVDAGHSVKLTITASPDQVEGNAMPVGVDSVGWTPDSGSTGATAYGGCTTSPGPPITCSRPITQSGTLHVIAHVNGSRKTSDHHVAVRNRTLTLTASPTSVNRGTDLVTFTPQWADGYPITVKNWEWVPDSSMSLSDGDCGSLPVCRTHIRQKGTVWVTVIRDGAEYRASARVDFAPCQTGNSLLDTPGVRQAIWRVWDESGAERLPPSDRREIFYAVYRYDDGSTAEFPIQGTPTPCEGGEIVPPPKVWNGGQLIATVHPHVIPYGDAYPSNCSPFFSGGSYRTGAFQERLGMGRASGADWRTPFELGVPSIIVDFDQFTIADGTSGKFFPLGDGDYAVTNAGSDHRRTDMPRTNGGCRAY